MITPIVQLEIHFVDVLKGTLIIFSAKTSNAFGVWIHSE